jgi:signal transduction histidine kinase
MDLATSSSADRLANDPIAARAFLATIGHELRTPLASINGYLESVLEGGNDPRTTRRFLETARREALRMGRLVDGLLVRSPFESWGDDRRAACNVVEQIRATIEMLSPMAAARRVTIRTHLPERLHAFVDSDACVHALANLLDNAVKHGAEEGTVDVWCLCEDRFVAIAVEDDGGGVAPEARDAIFTMGVRGATAAPAGNGIGLAVVKAVAERAGGDVRVEGSRSGGARFVLRFPAG